jgi:hypothetical protein
MTTLGLAISHESRLDVVTDTGKYHEALLATDEAHIFDALTGARPSAPTAAQRRRDVGEMVIALAGVNLRALRPDHFAELHESKGFRAFQRVLRASAHAIDRNVAKEEYEQQLRDEAEAIVDAWHQARREFRSEIRKVLYEQGAANLAREGLSHWLGAATNLKLAAGIAVAVITARAAWSVRKLRPHRQHFLTQVHRRQDKKMRLMFPLGIER